MFFYISSPARSVLLPCSCPTAVLQQPISVSTRAARHTSARSVGAAPSRRPSRRTSTTPVCTLHAASDTGLVPEAENWLTELEYSDLSHIVITRERHKLIQLRYFRSQFDFAITICFDCIFIPFDSIVIVLNAKSN